MRFYAIALYDAGLQTNEVRFGWSESENLGTVVIDIIEDEENAKEVERIIDNEYGGVDIETVLRYYNDGDIVVSMPVVVPDK